MIPSKSTTKRDQGKTGTRRIPALVQFAAAGTTQCLLLTFHGQYAITDAKAVIDAQIHETTRRFIGDNIEMIGFTAQHTAQRHIAIEMLTGSLARLGGEVNCWWNFKRTRNFDAFELRPCRLKSLCCSLQEGIRNMGVEPGFDD